MEILAILILLIVVPVVFFAIAASQFAKAAETLNELRQNKRK